MISLPAKNAKVGNIYNFRANIYGHFFSPFLQVFRSATATEQAISFPLSVYLVRA